MQLKNIKPGTKFILASALNKPYAIATVYEKMRAPRFNEELLSPDTKHCQLRLKDWRAVFIPLDAEVIELDLHS